MKDSLIEEVNKLGAWSDLVMPCGRQAQGIGEPWYPPNDTVAIDCREIFKSAWYDKKGRQAWVPHQSIDSPPPSHAQEILKAFDEGPSRFNPPIVVPFKSTWLEWGSLDESTDVRLGSFVCESSEDVDGVAVWHIMRWPGISQPFFVGAWSTHKSDWHLQGFRLYPATNKWLATSPESLMSRVFSTWRDDEAAYNLFNDIRLITATHLALRLPNTRVAAIHDAPVRMAKKQKRVRPHQRIRWTQLVMCGSSGGMRRRAAKAGGGVLRAEHMVRAHIALYTEEAPLFGNPEMVGWFERPAHKRGSRKAGIVVQARRIEPS